MRKLVFTVHDRAAAAYLEPFFARSEGEAIRAFSSAAQSEDHNFGQHSADYTLFKIGSFDDETSVLESHAPVSLGNALDYKTANAGSRSAPRLIDPRQMDLVEEAQRAR